MNNIVRRLSTSGAPNYAQAKVNHEFHKIVKWIRPEKLPVYAPQRTCDLRPIAKVDPNWLTVDNQPFADIIDKLPEEQRKLFTVDFGRRSEGYKVILQDAIKSVQRHNHDYSSHETKLTWFTIKIRSYQQLFATSDGAVKNSRLRHNLKELVDKRKKYLNLLRKLDYRRFEWIIDVLGILYRPHCLGVRIERKASITLLVNIMCEEIRQKKMREYRDLLESEKLPFLQEKLETLRQIELEEQSINMQSSVSEDIKDTIRKISLIAPDTLSNQE